MSRKAFGRGGARAVASVVPDRGPRIDRHAAYVRAAYRLRFELGPTIAPATLEQVRRDEDALRDRLLVEGVSRRLLGLED